MIRRSKRSALRSAHGKARKCGQLVVVEQAPPDELPAGIPEPPRPVATRDAAGRFVPGTGTTAIARRGGLAAAESRQLAQLLGLWTPPEDHPYAPYARLAREWRDQHLARVAASVGGGSVGPGPASIISTAAMQLGASRWAYDQGAKTGDAALLAQSSRLGNDSKQSLLAAHELAVRECAARPPDPQALADAVRAASRRRSES
jgi:hypothetical protein